MAADYGSMKVQALKELLADRGLPQTGKKNELVERLVEWEAQHGGDCGEIGVASTTDIEGPSNMTAASEDDEEAADDEVVDDEAVDEVVDDIDNPICEDSNANDVANPICEDDYQIESTQVEEAVASQEQTENTTYEGGAGIPIEATKPRSGSTTTTPAVEVTKLTDEERLALRKQKFGITSDEDKMLARAKRFGLNDPALEEEKKKLRSARFGVTGKNDSQTSTSSTVAGEVDVAAEAEKKKKRGERFGIVPQEEKMRKRMERFNTFDEEEKKARRLQRFEGGTAEVSIGSPAAATKVA